MDCELRCESSLQAVVIDGELEIKCRNSRCGARSGIVVLHRFSLDTGAMLRTYKFTDPNKKGGETNGIANIRTSLRTA